MSKLTAVLIWALLIVLAIVGFMLRSAAFLGTVLTVMLTLVLLSILGALAKRRK
ncbi:hypothetical protein [Lacticaseibacillus hulanensis]|uniref:hypothetical protein n=1 Tax=Lacticaseibacillus hulanensis TaxID=2493111 RepID=UPI0013E39149|nr:hypothetical protein [Lacticaseibacillus hulanensis]